MLLDTGLNDFDCIHGGGWVHLYSFICLSAGAVECESSCFAITTALCTSKGDISVSAICHLWRFILIDWYIGWPS